MTRIAHKGLLADPASPSKDIRQLPSDTPLSHPNRSRKLPFYWRYLTYQSESTPTFAMLTDSIIRKTLAKDRYFKLFDSGGLFLLIRSNAQRGWRFKYRISGHEKLISLGPYPTVSLAKARLQLKRAKALLLDGIDPSVKRQAEKMASADSFEAITREWFATQTPRWLPSHADKVIRRLERDVFPWIGKHPIKKLWPKDLLGSLKRIEARGNLETAHRAYQTSAGYLGTPPLPDNAHEIHQPRLRGHSCPPTRNT
jgi:Arm DNA-binding domain